MRLDGTTIVVTGAAGGLGNAMASAFAAEGANVVGVDTDEDRLIAAVDAFDGDAVAVPTDVRSWDDVRDTIETARAAHGEIDVLVNNAGVQQRTAGGDRREPVVDVPVDIWETVVETNLTGVFHCTKAVLPGLLDRDDGRLIHVSSGAGERGRANRSPYVASKHGVEGFAASLALELEGSGVESLVFRPPGGGIFTESRSHRDPEDFTHDSPTIVAEPMIQLAAGAGENGGRYVGTDDGEGFETRPR